MPKPRPETVSLRLICLFQPRDKWQDSAYYADQMAACRPGFIMKTGQQVHEFLWSETPPENLWLEFFTADFQASCLQGLTLFQFNLDFRQLRSTWICKAPSWVQHTPLRESLVAENGRRGFTFVIHAITAWVFSNGFLSVQIDIAPGFNIHNETVLDAAFLLNQLTLPNRRFKQVFKNEKQKESFLRRYAGPDQHTRLTALQRMLSGEESSFAELLQEWIGSAFEPAARKFLPYVCLKKSDPESVTPVFSTDDISRFLAVSQGLSPNYQQDLSIRETDLYTDGRSKIIWGITGIGAGCMVKLTDPDKDVFLSTRQFDQRVFDLYMPLYITGLYFHYGILWLQQAVSECSSRDRFTFLGKQMDGFRPGVFLDYPSQEDFHNRYFMRLIFRLSIKERWETLEKTALTASRRLESISAATNEDRAVPGDTDAIRLPQSGMAQIWARTGSWFTLEGTEAWCKGELPHHFAPVASAGIPAHKVIEGFTASGCFDGAPEYALQLKQLELNAKQGNLSPAVIQKCMVQAWFSWMPDHWFDDPLSAGHIHSALKTIIGAHSTAISASGRPPSVAGIYILLCHTIWCRLNPRRTAAQLPITVEELDPDWNSAIDARDAAFMASQSPADTRRTLQFLEHFFRAFFLTEDQEPPITQIEEMVFHKHGSELEIELTHPDILDGLHRRVQTTVRDMTQKPALPFPGSTTAALIHLYLRLMMGRTTFGAPGGIRMTKTGQLLIFGGKV